MKSRFLIFAIVVTLLVPALVFAESEMPVSSKFDFRNGITWGLSIEEVTALESGEASIESVEPNKLVSYNHMSVSEYSVPLSYVFQNDSLISVLYYFEDYTLRDYFYLAAALSSKYGEPIAPDINRQLTLFQLLGIEDEYSERITNWELADGTYICLFAPDEDADEFVLMYFDEDSLMLKNKAYNTTGL